MRQAASHLLLTAFALAASACGAKAVKLPTDPGTALAEYVAIHRELSMGCSGVRTLRTELSLSGKANGNGLRGSIAAGFRAPDDMRLEFRVLPLRTHVFTLAANAKGATLLLVHDKQVVRGARSEDLLAALTGIALAPSDLMAMLTGCVVPSPNPTGGHQHAGGWASIDLAGGATLYAQHAGDHWQLRAARRGNWRIDYVDWPATSRFPNRVVLTSDTPVAVDLRATLNEPEANIDLGDDVFVVSVPPDTEVVPLERLRQSGPLRDR